VTISFAVVFFTFAFPTFSSAQNCPRSCPSPV
jgi:hypothetical protein